MNGQINDIKADIVEHIKVNTEKGQFEFSQHATDQSIIRRFGVQEVREAVHTIKTPMYQYV